MSAPTFAPTADWDKKNGTAKIKKKGNPLFFILAIVLLVLAGSAIFRATHEAPAEKMVPVVTLTRDIPPGTRLGLMNLHLINIPKRFVTSDTVTSLQYATGCTSRTFIAGGEPLIRTQLFDKGSTLPTILETHERAITLQMSDDGLIDHCLNPDDRVDILCVSTNDASKKFTRTIAVDSRVLMCVQKNQLSARKIGSTASNMITLAVTPDLAEAVTEAAEVGKIRLVLRNRLTRIEPHLKGVGPDDLLPASAFVVKEEAKKPWQSPDLPDVMPAIPAPPQLKMVDTAAAMPAPAAPTGPVQWVVEMFSGSHKETYGVPVK